MQAGTVMDRCTLNPTKATIELKIAIGDDEIEIDWDIVRAASAAYDAGNQSDGALWAKILTMSYDEGFRKGQENIIEHHMLAMAPPGGNA